MYDLKLKDRKNKYNYTKYILKKQFLVGCVLIVLNLCVYMCMCLCGRYWCHNARQWAGSIVWCCLVDWPTGYLLLAHNWSNGCKFNLFPTGKSFLYLDGCIFAAALVIMTKLHWCNHDIVFRLYRCHNSEIVLCIFSCIFKLKWLELLREFSFTFAMFSVSFYWLPVMCLLLLQLERYFLKLRNPQLVVSRHRISIVFISNSHHC